VKFHSTALFALFNGMINKTRYLLGILKKTELWSALKVLAISDLHHNGFKVSNILNFVLKVINAEVNFHNC
jgi:hypothetical protein